MIGKWVLPTARTVAILAGVAALSFFPVRSARADEEDDYYGYDRLPVISTTGSGTVDSKGGRIQLGEAEVAVPANAVEGPTFIRIVQTDWSHNPHPLPDYLSEVTDFFVVDSDVTEFAYPIRLRFPVNVPFPPDGTENYEIWGWDGMEHYAIPSRYDRPARALYGYTTVIPEDPLLKAGRGNPPAPSPGVAIGDASGNPRNPGFTLTVATFGKGTVTSDLPGIACPPTCQAVFPFGTTVQLKQSPEAPSVFAGWGGECRGPYDCGLTLNAHKTVLATFTHCAPPERSGDLHCSLPIISTSGSAVVDTFGGKIMLGPAILAVPANAVLDPTEFKFRVIPSNHSPHPLPGRLIPLSDYYIVSSDTEFPEAFREIPLGITVPIDASKLTPSAPDPAMYGWDDEEGDFSSFPTDSSISRAGLATGYLAAFYNVASVPAQGLPARAGFQFGAEDYTKSEGACTASAGRWSGSLCFCPEHYSWSEVESACTDVSTVVESRSSGPEEWTAPLEVTSFGDGKVTSTPSGISCPPTCKASFPWGTAVVLHAIPQAGRQSAGWGGEYCSLGDCRVTLNGRKKVLATFTHCTPADNARDPYCSLPVLSSNGRAAVSNRGGKIMLGDATLAVPPGAFFDGARFRLSVIPAAFSPHPLPPRILPLSDYFIVSADPWVRNSFRKIPLLLTVPIDRMKLTAQYSRPVALGWDRGRNDFVFLPAMPGESQERLAEVQIYLLTGDPDVPFQGIELREGLQVAAMDESVPQLPQGPQSPVD